MRVAFENGAVHKCARIAFVRVADNVLGVAGVLGGEAPLNAGGETCTTTAADAGSLHQFDNRLRGHLAEALGQALVTASGNIGINVLRIDKSGVPGCYSKLFFNCHS